MLCYVWHDMMNNTHDSFMYHITVFFWIRISNCNNDNNIFGSLSFFIFYFEKRFQCVKIVNVKHFFLCIVYNVSDGARGQEYNMCQSSIAHIQLKMKIFSSFFSYIWRTNIARKLKYMTGHTHYIISMIWFNVQNKKKRKKNVEIQATSACTTTIIHQPTNVSKSIIIICSSSKKKCVFSCVCANGHAQHNSVCVYLINKDGLATIYLWACV